MVEATIQAREMTFEEFEREYIGKRYEYVDGHAIPMGPEIIDVDGGVIVSPASVEHGLIVAEFEFRIGLFVRVHGLGRVFGADTGFLMTRAPEQLRAADVALISVARLISVKRGAWLSSPPDLAVEVISEHDLASDIRRKTEDYMENGARLLWIVYPDERLIDVYRPGEPAQTLRESDDLDGFDVLPGFSVPVAELFAPLDQLADS